MVKIPLIQGEHIIAEIRQRTSSFVWQWIGSFFLLLTASVGMFWFFAQGTWGIIGFSVLCFGGVWGVVMVLIRSRGTVLVLTTERVIDIVKDGLFGKTISEVDLYNIEDVVVRQRGLWRMLCKYGTIEIRIKDSKVRIVVDYVSRPVGIQRLINELRKQKIRTEASENQHSFEQIYRMINTLEQSELHRLRELIETKLRQLR